MVKLWCYGSHLFGAEACIEFCNEEQRRQCMFETQTEKAKVKLSWLKPS